MRQMNRAEHAISFRQVANVSYVSKPLCGQTCESNKDSDVMDILYDHMDMFMFEHE